VSGPKGWIGRRQAATDWTAPSLIDRFHAVLDRDAAPARPGDGMPTLSHWLLFLPSDRQSRLGYDGHGERGGFLPVEPDLPRRMWAGSRISFPGVLRAGMEVGRVSEIADVVEKTGNSGRLLFVTVRHTISEPGGPPLIREEHDIVYRSLSGAAAKSAPEAPGGAQWRRELVPDERLLFRYSALTFNGHRIHYDLAYATGAEGYPGLVVHGPLAATLMVELIGRELPGARIVDFSFKAVSPLFAGNRLTVAGRRSGPDRVSLWVANHEGGLAMAAEAVIGP